MLGATSLGTDYDFGYLDTTTNHDTWLTVLNNNSTPMQVTATYYPSGGGAPLVKLYAVAANGRGSIRVRNDLPAGTYSARVQLSQPGMVERPMYFKDGSTGRYGATDLVGVPASTTAWYFAEGQADSTHAEKLVLANQGASTANVHVVAYGSNGSAPFFDEAVPAGQQRVISVNGLVGLAAQHGFTITSDQPILADRVISLHYVGPVGTGTTKTIDGATDSTGAANVGQAFYFAEGYSGGNFAEYLEVVNPSASASATVTVSYLPTNGQAPTVRVYTIPAHARLTVYTNGVMPNQSFSMQVLSDQGIVAERTMVFIYSSSPFPPGANVAIGYQP